jgi:deazaflavin-dependent oxidoreductase (nitroreductase family)
VKRRLITALQVALFNRPVKALLARGITPPGVALLETTGRRSGRPRTTPVGEGLEGDTFWIVAEHGRAAGYVRNLEANPRVRVKVGGAWRTGTAHVLPDDDTRARQRALARGHPLRWSNAAAVRAMGTSLLTIRIDLDR